VAASAPPWLSRGHEARETARTGRDRWRRRRRLGLSLGPALVAALAGSAGAALLSATPVGPLPPGPVTVLQATRGSLVAVALPRPTTSSGRVWRVARPFSASVLREVSEADVGPAVVVVFRAVGTGQTTVRFALTRGDASPKALGSRAFRVTVR
jgi:hypothetical protein